MPSVEDIDIKYNVRPFVDAPPSNSNVDTLKLQAVDISLFKEGDEYLDQRKQLAKTLEESITTYGFFNLVNYGISPKETEYIRAIAYSVTTLPDEVKEKYLASASKKELETTKTIGGERGQGFKPKGYWAIKNNVRDSIVHYNFRDSCFDSFLDQYNEHPELVAYHLKEIAHYYNTIHREVLPKLLTLCDIILQVPEGTILKNYFQNSGTNQDDSGSHGRFMLYQPYSKEEESSVTENTWLRGHSDISAFSFITSQPMLSLQIKDYFTGDWRYVQHRPDSLIVNIGDAMEFISGGLFKACLHRVVEPPADQKQFERLAIIYFCNPSSKADLDPENIHSPKLASLGLDKDHKLKHWEKIQFHHWNYTKGHLLGRSAAGERNLVQFFGRTIERWHHFQGGITNV
ncbi:hypothetical protein PSN45_004758 [Yamadazyma tenuis]|uniref:Clavaminate synthase-like protein n=1 Tax=Candida tenuis (strain ATCC 10573 / BCRC 21748 / CBS 615 / JCM 9827 / NBRC 10315 / NRRL Y-1498 / VKM Y-70) TaxID=590646 RepID=G3B6M8_CANTC|nr:uncharacterized protein CANTEDRAFT_106557 [Yamadazyma tenuis ATCC 10573]EGV62973.1 hypothetical protein CANTEDRAFT_106557 [Yamadazyma tenuis ATCC 10573]WEJ97210.1 hypothetical protein PSN45_004758 [Yamadazyma tenuis]